jgi:hypothetical protein
LWVPGKKWEKLGEFAAVSNACGVFLGKILTEILQGFNL